MTPQRLREIYGDASPHAAAKVISQFDSHCRQFIEQSSFLLLATSDGTDLDVSPKGDPAGFVKVISDTKLLVPDRPGNNRIDGLMNILAHPKVALLFMIPSVTETLRVNGTAEISEDPDLCAQCQINGAAPKPCWLSRQKRFSCIAARPPYGPACGSPKAGLQNDRSRHCMRLCATIRN